MGKIIFGETQQKHLVEFNIGDLDKMILCRRIQIITGRLYIDNFIWKSPIAKVYSSPNLYTVTGKHEKVKFVILVWTHIGTI